MKLVDLIRDGARQLREIWNYPLHDTRGARLKALKRLLHWQLVGRISERTFIMDVTPRLRMHLRRGLASREIYMTGLHELHDLAFVAHILRPDERLLDVGANAGIYSLFVASEAGVHADAFEPVPEIADLLEENVRVNRLDPLVTVYRYAVGADKGTISLSRNQGPVTHRVQKGEDGIEVPVERLDNVVGILDTFTVLKVDVEGLELEVLAGAANLLHDPLLGAMVIETGELGSRYGHSQGELHKMLADVGFSPVRYDGLTRTLSVLQNIANTGNTIYVRDTDTIIERCRAAPAVRLQHRWI